MTNVFYSQSPPWKLLSKGTRIGSSFLINPYNLCCTFSFGEDNKRLMRITSFLKKKKKERNAFYWILSHSGQAAVKRKLDG